MNNFDEKNLENVSELNTNVITDDDAARKLPIKEKFIKFFKDLWFDFLASFKYNNMKLSGILICVPGVLLGFFILFHYNIISNLAFPVEWVNENGIIVPKPVVKDLSALFYFGLTICGTLNLFTGVTVMGKKNLGSVIGATVTSGLMIIFAVCYLYLIFMSLGYQMSGQVTAVKPINIAGIDFIMVMISVGVSVISSVLGVLLGFKNYDRTYNKRDAR